MTNADIAQAGTDAAARFAAGELFDIQPESVVLEIVGAPGAPIKFQLATVLDESIDFQGSLRKALLRRFAE